MHSNKNRFTLQKDLIHTVSQLPNDKAGELFKYILAFVNHQEPTSDDIIINLAFNSIKGHIVKDLNKRIQCSKAGKNSAQAKKNKSINFNEEPTTFNEEPTTFNEESTTFNEEPTTFNEEPTTFNEEPTNPQLKSLKTNKIDYQGIIDGFNDICKSLPHAYVTDDRKRKINTLLKTYTLDQIGIVFIKTSQSNYLMGKTVDWKANLSWILKPQNFVRILEGTFDNHIYNKNLFATPEEQWQDINDTVDKLYDKE